MNINEANIQINNGAEKTYARLCKGPYNLVIHSAKLEEAMDYISSGHPEDLSSFPLIRLESEITLISPKDISLVIINNNAEHYQLITKIEEIRLRGKKNATEYYVDIEKIVKATIKQFDQL